MYAQLGDIVFDGLIGFDSLQRDIEIRYADQELMNRKPSTDHTGQELTELKLSIKFHVSFCHPETELQRLIDLAESATVVPLILGNGRIIGDFTIRKISERPQQTDKTSNYTEVIVSVDLKEYVTDDKALQQSQAAKLNATAIASNNPNVIRGMPKTYVTANGKIVGGVRDANSYATDVDKLAKEAGSTPALYAFNSAKILKQANEAAKYLGIVNSLLQGQPQLDALAPLLKPETVTAIGSLQTLMGLLPITGGNINNVLSANNTVQGYIDNVKLYAAPLNAANISREL